MDHSIKKGRKPPSKFPQFNISQLKHQHILDFVAASAHDDDILDFQSLHNFVVGLPYPVGNLCQLEQLHDGLKELTAAKEKQDSNLEHYVKLYERNKTELHQLKKVKNDDIRQAPRFITHMSRTDFIEYDPILHYQDGFLEYTFHDNALHCLIPHSDYKVNVLNAMDPRVVFEFELPVQSPILSIKRLNAGKQLFLIRQRNNVTAINPFLSDSHKSEWSTSDAHSPFTDANFNAFKEGEVGVTYITNKLEIINCEYDFPVTCYQFAASNVDKFSQFKYMDTNTIVCINREAIYLLDLRSLSVNEMHYDLPKCDDLCHIVQCDSDDFYVASLHHLVRMNVRNLKAMDRVTHLLASTPFMSSVIKQGGNEYISLSGENNTDSVIIKTTASQMGTPMYVPNFQDTFRETLLTKKLNLCEELNQRLAMNYLGRKLIRMDKRIFLYSANAVGEMFVQRLYVDADRAHPKDHLKAIINAEQWINAITPIEKPLEVTTVCNLSDAVYKLATGSVNANNVGYLSQPPNLERFFRKQGKYVAFGEGSIGEAMSSIWTDMPEGPQEKAEHKVAQWLDTVKLQQDSDEDV